MLLSFLLPALACEPTAERVGKARALFEDVELEQARTETTAALEELHCQTEVVERGTLLELYRLDAQVAMANLDKKAATYATIRSVAVDPTAVPTADYGPDLAALHKLWAKRLGNSRIMLSVSGGGIVYLDGLPLRQGERMATVPGEHLVQIDSGTAVISTVTDLDKDQAVITGIAAPSVAPDPRPLAPPTPVPRPAPLVDLDGPEPKAKKKRQPTPVLLAVGGGLVVLGGGLLGYAWYRDEVVFAKKAYPSVTAVNREAATIRALYGTGYGIGAVGLAVGGVGLYGRQVHVRASWRF